MATDLAQFPPDVRAPAWQSDSFSRRVARSAGVPRRWALALIVLVAAFCNFFELQREGFANLYYAAAIRSMLESWHNFFFVSFDPGGFVTVDKPPLGFWIQAASAKLLGFSGFSILLPEALAGVASVGVLYVIVRRILGTAAGLIAALFLAITPISVVTSRNNTIDSLLVLTVLLAAYAVTRAVERGSLRWLLLSAVLVGLGFNIKMLEAYLVVPALAVVYLLGAPLGWWKRTWHLALAGMALIVVSLSWVVAVDLTPASARPYVGSSGSNSELALALGYNGIQRLLGQLFRIQANINSGVTITTGPGGPGGVSENGAQGLFRLLNAELGGQASWLLALGLVGMLAAGWGLRPGGSLRRFVARPRAWLASAEARHAAHLSPQQSALVLWGVWTLTMAAFFSVAGFFHRYYLSMLAPGIAALAGIGVVLLWRDYRSSAAGWRGWLLPAALVVTALTQAVILADYSGWNGWMTPLIVGGSIMVATALVWLRLSGQGISLVAGRRLGPAFAAPDGPAAAEEIPYVDADSSPAMGHPVVSPFDPAPVAAETTPTSTWTLPRWLPTGLTRRAYAPLVAAALGVAVLLVGPATWVGVSLANGGGGTLPAAGPSAALTQGGRFGGGAGGLPGGRGGFGGPPIGTAGGTFPSAPPAGFAGPSGGGFGGARSSAGGSASQGLDVNSAVVRYLEANQGSATYLFATLSSQTAAPYIIATGKPVMALGGFSGSDQILTLSQLKALIREGKVKYFLLSGGGFGGPGGGSGNSALVQWVESHGTQVPASAYGGSSAGGALYVVSASAANS